MERTMSIEEKIKRAEEIYARRQEGNARKMATVSLNNENKKDIKLLKKMMIQILMSLMIYAVIYIVQNNNYIFSEEFLKKANEILSYDTNFQEIYENIKDQINNMKANQNTTENAGIGGAENNIEDTNILNQTEEVTTETTENTDNIENTEEQKQEENLSQMTQEEQDIAEIKTTTTFIKPIEGIISSKYGQRESANSSVPKNHTGTDIAASLGTKIKAATSGEVVLASEQGDYGKHLKIQIGKVSVVYAHCNALYVKQGDHVEQGQEIAEVGSTGNSTGPHLHFEIRISERFIDPQKILEL